MMIFPMSQVHLMKGFLECDRLSSVSLVPAIACAFSLRECVSLLISFHLYGSIFRKHFPIKWFQPMTLNNNLDRTSNLVSYGRHGKSIAYSLLYFERDKFRVNVKVNSERIWNSLVEENGLYCSAYPTGSDFHLTTRNVIMLGLGYYSTSLVPSADTQFSFK